MTADGEAWGPRAGVPQAAAGGAESLLAGLQCLAPINLKCRRPGDSGPLASRLRAGRCYLYCICRTDDQTSCVKKFPSIRRRASSAGSRTDRGRGTRRRVLAFTTQVHAA